MHVSRWYYSLALLARKVWNFEATSTPLLYVVKVEATQIPDYLRIICNSKLILFLSNYPSLPITEDVFSVPGLASRHYFVS